jgi:hypothetical protein
VVGNADVDKAGAVDPRVTDAAAGLQTRSAGQMAAMVAMG